MRCFRFLPLLGLLAALLIPATASAAEIGLNINGGAASGTAENFDQLGDTGSKWARHFVFWDDAHLESYDDIVAQEDARGIKTLFVVAAASHQAPSDPEQYAEFIGAMARRWKGRLEAIEIWNEQDEGQFWSGGPNPAKYVDLLQRSYTAAKAADPSVKVVFGPTVGNNYGFLEQAYAAGAKGYFDVMAAHTDTACLVDSPMDYYRDPAAGNRIGRFVFLGYRELRATMLANGDDKPIWLTEIGWSAAQHTCETGAWAGQKLAGVTEAAAGAVHARGVPLPRPGPVRPGRHVVQQPRPVGRREDEQHVRAAALRRQPAPGLRRVQADRARAGPASPARAATSSPRGCRSCRRPPAPSSAPASRCR